jgi:hypothetical protein
LPDLKGMNSPSTSIKRTIIGLSNVSTTANLSLKHSPVGAESKVSVAFGDKDFSKLKNLKSKPASNKKSLEHVFSLANA